MSRGIYKIINIINNKFYVGSAVDLKRRKTRHFSELRTGRHNNRHLQAAWLKHGEQAFVFAVVEELGIDADLLAAENVWLKEHVGKDYCYNLGVHAAAPMLGKSGKLSPTWGYKHTPEARALIMSARTGRTHRPEDIEKIRQHWIGKPKSAATRAKISAALSGKGNFWYGKKRPEHGAKVSRAVHVNGPNVDVIYPSISAAREALNLTPPTVNRALKSGKPISRGKMTGWTFKYVAAPL